MMDESKEGLLSPAQRYHSNNYDPEAGAGDHGGDKFARTRRSISSDMDDSDLDATEFLTSDPLANPSPNDRTPAFLTGQRAGISLTTLKRPFRGRSKCCVTTCVLILIIWLLLGAGGAFVFVAINLSLPILFSKPADTLHNQSDTRNSGKSRHMGYHRHGTQHRKVEVHRAGPQAIKKLLSWCQT